MNHSTKTIYVAFHDAPRFGDTPYMKYEPRPVQIEISHGEAVKIVDHLYAELKRITTPKPDAGAWPNG